jgi:hypothetical protein
VNLALAIDYTAGDKSTAMGDERGAASALAAMILDMKAGMEAGFASVNGRLDRDVAALREQLDGACDQLVALHDRAAAQDAQTAKHTQEMQRMQADIAALKLGQGAAGGAAMDRDLACAREGIVLYPAQGMTQHDFDTAVAASLRGFQTAERRPLRAAGSVADRPAPCLVRFHSAATAEQALLHVRRNRPTHKLRASPDHTPTERAQVKAVANPVAALLRQHGYYARVEFSVITIWIPEEDRRKKHRSVRLDTGTFDPQGLPTSLADPRLVHALAQLAAPPPPPSQPQQQPRRAAPAQPAPTRPPPAKAAPATAAPAAEQPARKDARPAAPRKTGGQPAPTPTASQAAPKPTPPSEAPGIQCPRSGVTYSDVTAPRAPSSAGPAPAPSPPPADGPAAAAKGRHSAAAKASGSQRPRGPEPSSAEPTPKALRTAGGPRAGAGTSAPASPVSLKGPSEDDPVAMLVDAAFASFGDTAPATAPAAAPGASA